MQYLMKSIFKVKLNKGYIRILSKFCPYFMIFCKIEYTKSAIRTLKILKYGKNLPKKFVSNHFLIVLREQQNRFGIQILPQKYTYIWAVYKYIHFWQECNWVFLPTFIQQKINNFFVTIFTGLKQQSIGAPWCKIDQILNWAWI